MVGPSANGFVCNAGIPKGWLTIGCIARYILGMIYSITQGMVRAIGAIGGAQ